MNELEIKCYVKVGKTKAGKSFNFFKTELKGGKLVDLKFTKAVTTLPNESCILIVNEEDINVDNTRLYPCVWCRGYISNKPLVKKSVADYFEN